MSLSKSAASGVRWTSVSMLCVTLMETARIIILGRILPPEAFGLVAMMGVVIGFGQIFSQMGLAQAVIQRPLPHDNELVSLYWLNIAAGMSVFFLLLLLTPFVARLYKTPEIKAMLPYAGLIFVFNPFGDLYRAMLEKKMLFKALAGIEMSGAVVGMVLSIFLASAGFGVWSLIWGQLCTVVYHNFGFFLLGQKMFQPRLYFRKGDLKGYLRFGLHRMGAMSTNYINSNIDRLLIGAILGPQALGYYSMAFNLIMRPVQRINPILTRVAFPVLAQVQGDNERMKRGYFKMLNILTTVNAPLLLGMTAVATVAVPIVLGDKWLPIVPVVQVLAPYSLIRSTGSAGGSMVLAKGRADAEFYWNLFLFCFTPVVIFCAAYFGSLLTLAWALFALQAMLFFLWYALIVRKLLGPCFKEYVGSVGMPVSMAASMGAVVYLFGRLLPGQESVLILTAQVMLGVVTYLSLYTFFGRRSIQEQMRLLFNRA